MDPTPSWPAALVSSLKPATVDTDPFRSDPRYISSATLILPRLYLSDFISARNEDEIHRLGITHIVTVLESLPANTKMPDLPRHQVPVADRSDVDILKYLDGTTKFIQDALGANETNQVLVHCMQGISRSATVVCAYVIAQACNGMTAADAVDFVREKRPIVCPNAGFRVQLAEYSERFVGNRATHRVGGPSATKGRKSKISVGIFERIRRLKSGATRVAETADGSSVVVVTATSTP
ncbi:hypothetical protein FRB95_008048 [Tulasnella sp. JGI-2019a]|nr:hypothetical protein FRB95_008048 [Tulasnella sp. JGI-2019a]